MLVLGGEALCLAAAVDYLGNNLVEIPCTVVNDFINSVHINHPLPLDFALAGIALCGLSGRCRALIFTSPFLDAVRFATSFCHDAYIL